MNVPVSYPSCKLLVDKGFDEKCSKYYEIGKSSCVINLLTPYRNSNFDRDLYPNADILAPTIADVVMWLYEKYGIWISVTKDVDIKWSNDYFNYHILSPQGTTQSDIGGTQPNSPTEAYQEAIKYVLHRNI
jgi:hypothetical protein